MKWSGWIVVSLAAVVAVAAHAAEPRAPARLARTSISLTRYAEEPKAAAAAPITPHAPVHYRQATWDIWSGTSTGYVYAPGACDYTPPCVNHLWDGYEQRPHRCNEPHRRCGGMHGCGSCGGGSCGAVSSCGSCGGGHCSLLKRAHGWHFGGKVWSGCSSCSDMAPSCGAPTCAAPSCAAPSCGCEASGKDYDAPAPAPSDAPAPAPPAPKPVAGGEDPTVEIPMLEKTTRGNRLRGFTWPDNSLQR